MSRRILAYVLRVLSGVVLAGFCTSPAYVCDVEDGVLSVGHQDDDAFVIDWDDIFHDNDDD